MRLWKSVVRVALSEVSTVSSFSFEVFFFKVFQVRSIQAVLRGQGIFSGKAASHTAHPFPDLSTR